MAIVTKTKRTAFTSVQVTTMLLSNRQRQRAIAIARGRDEDESEQAASQANPISSCPTLGVTTIPLTYWEMPLPSSIRKPYKLLPVTPMVF